MLRKTILILAFMPLLLASECMHAFLYGTDEEFQEAKTASLGGMTLIDPPRLNFEAPPPPIPNASVVMTNSRGETVFEGMTNASGVANGNRGPGSMDHELNIQVRTPDGTELMQKFQIPAGWTLIAIHVQKNTGVFVPEWKKPPELRGDERDSEDGRHDSER